MEGLDSLRYQTREAAHSEHETSLAPEQLRGLLSRLISSSSGLNLRVWLDGVYTDLENTEVQGDWMKGREVYFKVEGRVDGLEATVNPRMRRD